jgi:ElaB/YqjD/DUF883 family membrane-anchored ribosome-binding protein
MKTPDKPEVNLEQFLEDLKAVVRDGQGLLRSQMSGAGEQAQGGMRAADRIVREHPYPSIGIVFGLGILAGALATSWFLQKAPEESED